ncbi:MAG: ArgE/DapE family deacylase [Thermoplasmatales archaeon]|jgi:succinyl-diaminopimelate desuccinylase|nr:ArgE/DapE family deacylase [Candidatus Thermoplasmatota archaeon]MDA8055377.1 ArgE/DapE family deacylase [Thermoplasmatales archaeon]
MTKILQEKLLNSLNGADLLKLASDLIKINSENPPGNLAAVNDFIQFRLKSEGLNVEKLEPERGKVTQISKIGNPPYLILNGHTDTVPIGTRALWEFDPFSGKITEDRILGRGASDMKAGLAGILYSFLIASHYEDELENGIVLMAVPDEETGGRFGTRWVLDNTTLTKETSAALVAEPTEIDNIEIGQRGSIWGIFKSKGESAHGSLSPYVGKNAITNLFICLEKVKEITKIKAEIDSSLKRIVEDSKAKMQELIGVQGVSNAMDHISMNVGKIVGGTKVNMVPDSAEAEVDFRIPIGMTSHGVEELISKALRDFEGITFESQASHDPNNTSPDSKIARVVGAKIEELLDLTHTKTYQWASSDARYFRYKNVETVQYGPATLKGIHSYNESVKVSDVINATKVYLGVISEFAQPN